MTREFVKGENEMKTQKLLAVLFALLLVAVGGYAYAKSAERTPEYAMEKIVQAVHDKDAETLARYVDTEGLATLKSSIRSIRPTGSSAMTRRS